MEVSCEKQSLTRVPEDLPRRTTILNLSSNDIKNIDTRALATSAPGLIGLFLDSNMLHTLDVSKLENLEYLSASNNYLSSFKGSRNLLSVNLNVNRLGVNSLAPLDLTLSDNLLYLEAKGNFLTSENLQGRIPNSVQFLGLASNDFTNFDLMSLPARVEKIDLSRNRITDISGCYQEIFSGAVSLSLALNLLSSIDESTFANCGGSFTKLDLSHNKIEEIGDNAFGYPSPKAQSAAIILSYNKLKNLNFTSIEKLIDKPEKETPIRIDLDNNPIQCTREMTWVPQMNLKNKQGDRVTVNGRCMGPTKLNEKLLEELTEEDLDNFTAEYKIPFWQIFVLVFVIPGVAAMIALTLAIRMHWKDYKKIQNYVQIQSKREQMTKKKRNRHFRASAQLNDVLINSVH